LCVYFEVDSYYKDQVEELQPLYDVITESKHKSCIEQFKQALGKTRKAEAYHKDRRYYPRIMKDDGYAKQAKENGGTEK